MREGGGGGGGGGRRGGIASGVHGRPRTRQRTRHKLVRNLCQVDLHTCVCERGWEGRGGGGGCAEDSQSGWQRTPCTAPAPEQGLQQWQQHGSQTSPSQPSGLPLAGHPRPASASAAAQQPGAGPAGDSESAVVSSVAPAPESAGHAGEDSPDRCLKPSNLLRAG